MAVRIQNIPKKSFDQPQFTISCPSWWNLNEQQVPESFSNNISFKVESSPKPHAYHDQDSSSTQSIGQSRDNVGAVGETNAQDQCYSSESGEDESQGKGAEGKMKPVFLLGPPDNVIIILNLIIAIQWLTLHILTARLTSEDCLVHLDPSL